MSGSNNKLTGRFLLQSMDQHINLGGKNQTLHLWENTKQQQQKKKNFFLNDRKQIKGRLFWLGIFQSEKCKLNSHMCFHQVGRDYGRI